MLGQHVEIAVFGQAQLVDALDLPAFGFVVVFAQVFEDGLFTVLAGLPQVGLRISGAAQGLQKLGVDFGLGGACLGELESRRCIRRRAR